MFAASVIFLLAVGVSLFSAARKASREFGALNQIEREYIRRRRSEAERALHYPHVPPISEGAVVIRDWSRA